MISTLVYLLVALIVVGLIIWLVQQVPGLDPQLVNIVRVVAIVIFVIYVIYILMGLLGGSPAHTLR